MKKEINLIEDVLEINGTTKTPEFAEFEGDDHKHELAKWTWEQIVQAYNKLRDPKYRADHSDPGHRKYVPWCEIKKDDSQPSGFAFSVAHCYYTLTVTCVGSRRLCFASSIDVIDALEKFGQQYIKTLIY